MSKVCTVYTHDGEPPFQVAIVSDESEDFTREQRVYLENIFGLKGNKNACQMEVIEWPPSDLNINLTQ